MCLGTQEVNKEESKVSISDRNIILVIIKADSVQEHWPRLLHGKGKVTNIQVRCQAPPAPPKCFGIANRKP